MTSGETQQQRSCARSFATKAPTFLRRSRCCCAQGGEFSSRDHRSLAHNNRCFRRGSVDLSRRGVQPLRSGGNFLCGGFDPEADLFAEPENRGHLASAKLRRRCAISALKRAIFVRDSIEEPWSVSVFISMPSFYSRSCEFFALTLWWRSAIASGFPCMIILIIPPEKRAGISSPREFSAPPLIIVAVFREKPNFSLYNSAWRRTVRRFDVDSGRQLFRETSL